MGNTTMQNHAAMTPSGTRMAQINKATIQQMPVGPMQQQQQQQILQLQQHQPSQMTQHQSPQQQPIGYQNYSYSDYGNR